MDEIRSINIALGMPSSPKVIVRDVITTFPNCPTVFGNSSDFVSSSFFGLPSTSVVSPRKHTLLA